MLTFSPDAQCLILYFHNILGSTSSTSQLIGSHFTFNLFLMFCILLIMFGANKDNIIPSIKQKWCNCIYYCPTIKYRGTIKYHGTIKYRGLLVFSCDNNLQTLKLVKLWTHSPSISTRVHVLCPNTKECAGDYSEVQQRTNCVNHAQTKVLMFQHQDEHRPQYSVFAGSDEDRVNGNYNRSDSMAINSQYFVLAHEAVAKENFVSMPRWHRSYN